VIEEDRLICIFVVDQVESKRKKKDGFSLIFKKRKRVF
jgi:hypothetical protein